MERNEKLLFNGYRISFLKDENYVGMDSGGSINLHELYAIGNVVNLHCIHFPLT